MTPDRGTCMDCGAERWTGDLHLVTRVAPYRHTVLVCCNFIACLHRRRRAGRG